MKKLQVFQTLAIDGDEWPVLYPQYAQSGCGHDNKNPYHN
jgi:hypothetical protein